MKLVAVLLKKMQLILFSKTVMVAKIHDFAVLCLGMSVFMFVMIVMIYCSIEVDEDIYKNIMSDKTYNQQRFISTFLEDKKLTLEEYDFILRNIDNVK